MLPILIALHLLAALVWVGGMIFAHVMLRPVLADMEGPVRLAVFRGVFARFFPAVWLAILVLLATGYAMVFGFQGGFAGTGWHVHAMQATGLVMMALFGHLYFAPWRRFRLALADGAPDRAAAALKQIRLIVTVNLVLGVVTVVLGSAGRYWI